MQCSLLRLFRGGHRSFDLLAASLRRYMLSIEQDRARRARSLVSAATATNAATTTATTTLKDVSNLFFAAAGRGGGQTRFDAARSRIIVVQVESFVLKREHGIFGWIRPLGSDGRVVVVSRRRRIRGGGRRARERRRRNRRVGVRVAVVESG